MADLNREIAVLHELENARKAIRHKHKLLKLNRIETERDRSETFKPIVQPLEKLIQAKQQKQQQQFKVDKRENILPPAVYRNYFDLLERESEHPKKEKEEEEQEVEDAGWSGADKTQEMSFMSAKDEKDSNDEFDGNTTVKEKPIVVPSPIKSYIEKLGTMQTKNLDTKYGVRPYHNKLKIGDKLVMFDKNIITVGDDRYEITPGLIELIFKEEPNNSIITPEDLTNYTKIIKYSNAHRMYYQPTREFRTDDKSEKYMIYIKPIIESAMQFNKTGRGVSSPYKITRNSSIDYVYWDDPNELVDRLQLLIAETSAGNPSHHNEIQSILEELREAQIIY